jgi:hypothetical protein
LRDLRRCLKQRDYNGVQSQKNIYLMIHAGLKEVNEFL